MSETNSTETELETSPIAATIETTTIITESSNNKTSSKPKWKPLLIDAPKRERKTYRAPGQRSRNNNPELNASFEEGVVPPHASNRKNNRGKSLDRQQTDQNDNNGNKLYK